MATMTKKKAKEIASENLRVALAAQFGSTVGNATTPTNEAPNRPNVLGVAETTPPPAQSSITDTAPPLEDDDEEMNDVSDEEEEEDEMEDAISVRHGTRKTQGPPSNRRRGFCNMDKVKRIVKVSGKIPCIFDDFIKGPSSAAVNSLLTGSIGCIIRSRVTLCAESWDMLPDAERKKLTRRLTPYFNIDLKDKRIWKWLEKKAAKTYKDWKADFSSHYKKSGKERIPKDLIHRKKEWDWLCGHFDSRQFKKRSSANTINRDKNESEHRSGRLPIIYRVVEHKENGEEFPIIPTYMEVHDTVNNPKAANNLDKMKKAALALKNAQKNANPEIPEAELPNLNWSDNLQVLEAGVGRKAGKETRGLGDRESSPTRRSRIDDEERIQLIERAEKAEATTKELKSDLDKVKDELAYVMTYVKQHMGFPTQHSANEEVI